MRINPCVENIENMKPNENGRFCSSCNKNIIDLTSKSNEEILSIYQINKGNLCGIVKPNQLVQRKYYHPLKRFAFSLMLVFGSSLFVFASDIHPKFEAFRAKVLSQMSDYDSDTTQKHIIKGFVYVEGKPLIDETVIVTIKESEFYFKTNEKGGFTFEYINTEIETNDLELTFKFRAYNIRKKFISLDSDQIFVGKVNLNEYEEEPMMLGEIEPVHPAHRGGIAPLDKDESLFD